MSRWLRPEDLFVGSATVSVLTALLPFTDVINTSDNFLLWVINESLTENVNVLFETTQLGGDTPDAQAAQPLIAGPRQQASLWRGPGELRRWWRISAYTDGPSYNPAFVRFGITYQS